MVRYDTLLKYIISEIAPAPVYHRVDGTAQAEDGVVMTLPISSELTFTVTVSGIGPDFRGSIVARRARNGRQTTELVAGRNRLSLVPGDYEFDFLVEAPKPFQPLRRSMALYQDVDLTLEMTPKGLSPAPTSEPVAEWQEFSAVRKRVAGRLASTTRGVVSDHDPMEEVRRAIFADLQSDAAGTDLRGGSSLTTADDLGTWLALYGGRRIVGASSPAVFDDTAWNGDGGSVHLLVCAPGGARIQATSDSSRNGGWTTLERTAIEGVLQCTLDVQRGPCLVSLFGGPIQTPYTFATATMEHRATLITVSFDSLGDPLIGQLILPTWSSLPKLPAKVAQRIGSRPLKDIVKLSRATAIFRRRGSLQVGIGSGGLGELLFGKWLDPVGAVMAGYEMVRRGKVRELGVAVRNLKEYFSDLPDTAALSRLAGDSDAAPMGTPLVADGLRAFSTSSLKPPHPKAQLDDSSIWTAWRGVVEPPAQADTIPPSAPAAR